MPKLPDNLFFTILTRCITLLSSFLISIFTAHYLGPVGRGNYFFVTAFATTLVQLGCLGMQSSNVFLVAKNEEVINGLIGNTLWISLAMTPISIICAIIYNGFYHHSIGINYIIVLTPTMLFYLLATNLLVGIKKSKLFNYFQLSSNLSLGAILLACGWMKWDWSNFLAATAVVWIIHALVLLFLLYQYTGFQFKFDIPLFNEGFLFGFKSYLATFFATLILQGNVFLLKHFASSKELGYYSIAQQISYCLTSFPAMCSLLLFPDLVRDSQNRWRRTKQALLMMGSPLFLICLLIAFSAKRVIPFIFGKQFYASALIVIWMLPGTFFLGLTSILSQYIVSDNFPPVLVIFWIIGFIVMVLISSWLIPNYYYYGAAISFSLSYLVVFILVCYLAYRKNSQEGFKSINFSIQEETFSV